MEGTIRETLSREWIALRAGGRINWFLPISLDLRVLAVTCLLRGIVIGSGDTEKEKVGGHEHARGTFDERGWRRRIRKRRDKGRWHPPTAYFPFFPCCPIPREDHGLITSWICIEEIALRSVRSGDAWTCSGLKKI